jgi:uncharacterized protein
MKRDQTIQAHLLWSGLEYQSMEFCKVANIDTGSEISSTIFGVYNGRIWRVSYMIMTSKNWETTSLELHCRSRGAADHFKLERKENGNWIANGKYDPAFDECIDIDISLTPFTNTLPINRLQLKTGQESEIKVIYFDLLNHNIKVRQQKYRRVSQSTYHFENIPNDFECDIKVDDSGYVIEYPPFFTRTAINIF